MNTANFRCHTKDLVTLLQESKKEILFFEDSQEGDLIPILKKILTAASFSPSDFNFQPVRYIIIHPKSVLHHKICACFSTYSHEKDLFATSQYIIICLTDKNAVYQHAAAIIDDDYSRGAISKRYARALHIIYHMGFSKKPMWIGLLFKKIVLPIVNRIMTFPNLPIINYKSWLYKQAGLSMMNVLHGVSTHNLGWKSIELFDERQVTTTIGVSPRQYYVPFIITVGRVQKRASIARSTLLYEQIVAVK